MFPTNDNNEENTPLQGSQPTPPQGAYPPPESQYPPPEGSYPPPQQNNQYQNPYGNPSQNSNPYGNPPQYSNPYGNQQQSNPYSTPLAGAPDSQPNPYGQQPPNNPYSTPLAGAPNQSPYPPPNLYGAQNPYGVAPPPSYGQPYGVNVRQVNGGLILGLGIVSMLFCGLILGPIAFFMGVSGLSSINRGQADPNQKGMVIGGLVCGIIGFFIHILELVFFGGAIVSSLTSH